MTGSFDVILVRHASTTWSGKRYCGRSDPSLSPAGRAEALVLADRLIQSLDPATRIVTSPSRRSVATAAVIADAAGSITIERDPRWLEADFGAIEGLGFDEVEARFPELAARLLSGSMAVDWPGGETSTALAARIESAWDDLVEDGRPVVVVTHAGPILHALQLARHGATTLTEIPAPAMEIRVTVTPERTKRQVVLPSPT